MDITWAHPEETFSPLSSTPAGGLCVWDVGSRWNRDLRGPANCRRPVRHQNASPQKEEQPQAPEEAETTGGLSSQHISHEQSGVFENYFLLLSNPEKPGTAVRTRPCCSPTALKMSSDLPDCKPPIPYRRLGKSEKEKSTSLWQPCLHPPKAVWLWLIWYPECEAAAQKSSLCPSFLIFLKVSMWALFPVSSGGADWCHGTDIVTAPRHLWKTIL